MEYLGDSVLNYAAGKLFYLETQEKGKLPSDYRPSNKLHDLKTHFTSNDWLYFTFCEHNIYSLPEDERHAVIEGDKPLPMISILYD